MPRTAASGHYTSVVKRSMAVVQTLPARCARPLRDHPRLAALIGSLQVDSPLILCYAVACVAVELLVPTGLKLHYFAVSSSMEISLAFLFQASVGHVLGHSCWSHLQHNLALILLTGPACEASLGAAPLSKVIVWTSLASAASHVALAPTGSVQLGASGVVFAFIMLSSLLQRRRQQLPLTFVLTAMLWLHNELRGFASTEPSTQHIAHSAHVVGAAVGTYFGHRVHVQKTWWGGTRVKFE